MKWVPAMAFVQHMLVGMCIAAAPAPEKTHRTLEASFPVISRALRRAAPELCLKILKLPR